MCVALTAAYVVLPPLFYLLSGMQWTALSDNRILQLNPSPEQFGAFAWWPSIYVISMALTYLLARGERGAGDLHVQRPDRITASLLVALATGLVVFFWFLEWIYGIDLHPSHAEHWAAYARGEVVTLPLVLAQITHNLDGILTILKFALLIMLMQRWQDLRWRTVLLLWLSAEVLVTVYTMGSRSPLVFMLLAALLAYHKLVRPLKPVTIGATALLLVVGAIGYGILRDYESAYLAAGNISPLSIANEFQILYGTALDLLHRSESGTLPPVPWQVYASDLLLLIPQQLLPFPKIDPAEWYLQVLGASGTGVGFMFGVTAQAVVGFGWPELVVRGCLTGGVLALVHRWYVHRQNEFWATLLYLWLCIWTYYSYRASTFYVVYFVIYEFLPLYVAVRFGRRLLIANLPAARLAQ